MSYTERVKSALEANKGNIPWPYGRKEHISEESKAAWKALSEIERIAISRHNPFRIDRNRALNKLYQLGLTAKILSELSGLRPETVRECVQERTWDHLTGLS